MKSTSLNTRDLLVYSHNPNFPKSAPNLAPLIDGAGIVEDVGSVVSQWKAGDRVIILPTAWLHGTNRNFDLNGMIGAGNSDGTLRTYMLWDEDRLVKVPAHLSMKEAATLFTTGVTAWNCLFHGLNKLELGMTVLTQGTGAVNLFAIMVRATTSSASKVDFLINEMKIDHVVNYRTNSNWSSRILELTNGQGVDIALDPIGSPENLQQTLLSTRFAGEVVIFGLLGQASDPTHDDPAQMLPHLFPGAKVLRGIMGGGSMQMMRKFCDFVEAKKLRPVMAKVFEFGEARCAFEMMENGREDMVGKIVIRV